jgi:hypothetical protein
MNKNEIHTGSEELDLLIESQDKILTRLLDPKPFEEQELSMWKKHALDLCLGIGETQWNPITYKPISKCLLESGESNRRKLATIVIEEYLRDRYLKANAEREKSYQRINK